MNNIKSNSIIYHQIPKIDYLFGYFGKQPILTKQDKFQPIKMVEKDENGNENILKDFYLKKPDNNSTFKFINIIKIKL